MEWGGGLSHEQLHNREAVSSIFTQAWLYSQFLGQETIGVPIMNLKGLILRELGKG